MVEVGQQQQLELLLVEERLAQIVTTWIKRLFTFTFLRGKRRYESNWEVFLHVIWCAHIHISCPYSKSGDWWTGPSIFAAKHLQPDYVKSIPIPSGFDPSKHFSEDEVESESGGMSWEEKQQLLHQIYDEGKLPDHLLITSSKEKDKDSSL